MLDFVYTDVLLLVQVQLGCVWLQLPSVSLVNLFFIFFLFSIDVLDNAERQTSCYRRSGIKENNKPNKSKSRSKWVRQRSDCYVYGQAYMQIMVSDNEDAPNRPKHLSNLRWRNRCSVKCWHWLFIIAVSSIDCVTANRPPQFLTGAQTEIVLRLKEGADTPVGE